MLDLWILAFIARGVIGAAGDVMPLDQCLQRAKDMNPANTHIACINVQDPSCRVYRDGQAELTAHCLNRARNADRRN